ncbi:hypothetical protein [Companilactobacillus furfuricola]|uniref:hypothetical protein n=1 Tax=Companilactobacillus furfuricola TaxID=1462575 RepID=UPI000F799268|nr:hypothetical protein [Companilactobacillus furfuricola]
MKDKKVLRNDSKITSRFLIAAKVVAIITAVVFFISFSLGTVNATISKQISNQYQDQQLGVIKKNVNEGQIHFIGKVIHVSNGHVISQKVVDQYRSLANQLEQRDQRNQDVAALYNGKTMYKNDVTEDRLDSLDKTLLKEKNQDVYQTQKNKLDTIKIWFEQTKDVSKYINDLWDKFNNNKASLTIKNISMVNTYDKLIKNRQVKNDLSHKVSTMNDYYNSHSNEDSKLANAKAELAALQNSPLTMKYKPANVDIISSLENSSKATDSLQQAGITDKHVLYYDKSKSEITFMTLTGDNYVADGSAINVSNGNVTSGSYTIKNIINSASDSAAIITDQSSSSFGKYLNDANESSLAQLGISDADNSTADYNAARPVFWFKNNSSLSTSIYFGNSSTIGFIHSGGNNYSNGVSVSNSGLSTIQAKATNGLLFYVK